MTKFVELHLIQNFAPSCLNRDDTNTPKDCVFGGFRRARISSQCLKRAIRLSPVFKNTLEQEIGCRSKLLVGKLADEIIKSKPAEESKNIASAFIETLLSTLEKDGDKTKVLLYLGTDEIHRMKDLLLSKWDELTQAISQEPEEQKTKKAKNKKLTPLQELCKDLKKSYKPGTKAADIALFGRMMAENPDINIDAASQVAHAISTHKVSMEMDFFTAVDDLLPESETGAGMMGMTGFNASCFYRYALIDVGQLEKNLSKDAELVIKTVEAFLRASVAAIPTGKQNSMAAHNPPDTILAVVRQKGAPVSLANAFEKPVAAWKEKSMVEASTEAMDTYWGKITGIYGDKGVTARPACSTFEGEMANLGDYKKSSFEEVIKSVLENISVNGEG
jgi:CRISPR system Cascade subunit CasC